MKNYVVMIPVVLLAIFLLCHVIQKPQLTQCKEDPHASTSRDDPEEY